MTFNAAACKRFASWALEQPPSHQHITRAEPPPGSFRVARFCLPLELCPTLNSYAQMEPWRRSKIKGQLLLLMRSQQPERLPMLDGRPWARGIRFSSVECDADSAFVKLAVDRLTPKNGGLGLIADDKPSRFELRTWWEKAPPGSGFVLLDLFLRPRTIETKEEKP